MGVSKRKKQTMAVKIISSVAANDLSIELRLLRKKEVLIPARAPLTRRQTTRGCERKDRSKAEAKLELGDAVSRSSIKLQAIESRYMYTFCTRMCTEAPLSLSRYSL